jgi:hypothetical protein
VYEHNYSGTTDAHGVFTATLDNPPAGVYQWRVKGSKYLANSGTVTLSGAIITPLEVGMLRVGDADNNNTVNVADFNITKITFGKGVGDPGYDDRADFDGNRIINVADFSLLKNTFGQGGAPPIIP